MVSYFKPNADDESSAEVVKALVLGQRVSSVHEEPGGVLVVFNGELHMFIPRAAMAAILWRWVGDPRGPACPDCSRPSSMCTCPGK